MDISKKTPVRILHVTGSMNRAGIETLVMNIYRNINRQIIQFDFLVHMDGVCDYEDEIKSLGGRIFHIKRLEEVGPIKYAASLIKVLCEQGPYSGVHSHIYYCSGFVLLISRLCGITLRIAHSHNTRDGKEGKNRYRRLYNNIMRFLIDLNTTHKLGCSKAACEALYGSKCWDDSRVKVINNSIDYKRFKRIEGNRYFAKERLNFPEDSILIGHIGRFNPQKNHEFLLDIFKKLHDKIPMAHLILVGDGELKDKIINIIYEKGLESCVHLLGIREDIPEIMAALDLFIFPSLFEGLGIVLIEAQTSGVPCLASSAVPEEADIGLNLVKFCELDKGADEWATQACLLLKRNNKLTQERIYNAIAKSGYDMNLSIKLWEEIYCG